MWIKALNMKLLNETNLNGKTVLLRVDLNVPVKGKKIADQSKIVLIKQTVAQLLKKNNKVFLLSHFGRPKGEVLPSLSLKSLSNPDFSNFSILYFLTIKFAESFR